MFLSRKRRGETPSEDLVHCGAQARLVVRCMLQQRLGNRHCTHCQGVSTSFQWLSNITMDMVNAHLKSTAHIHANINYLTYARPVAVAAGVWTVSHLAELSQNLVEYCARSRNEQAINFTHLSCLFSIERPSHGRVFEPPSKECEAHKIKDVCSRWRSESRLNA